MRKVAFFEGKFSRFIFGNFDRIDLYRDGVVWVLFAEYDPFSY
jgi:hypothetical protein